MADHSINALRAAARAMEEVVLPAIDPSHPLANEQARLVAKYLSLFAQRLEHAPDRNRFELTHYLGLAEGVLDDAQALSPAIAGLLRKAIRQGHELQAQAGAPLPHLQTSAQELAGLVAALVRTCATGDASVRQRIEMRVLLASKDLLDMQRAWFLPQGWEPDPTAIPSIDRVFGRGRTGADPQAPFAP